MVMRFGAALMQVIGAALILVGLGALYWWLVPLAGGLLVLAGGLALERHAAAQEGEREESDARAQSSA